MFISSLPKVQGGFWPPQAVNQCWPHQTGNQTFSYYSCLNQSLCSRYEEKAQNKTKREREQHFPVVIEVPFEYFPDYAAVRLNPSCRHESSQLDFGLFPTSRVVVLFRLPTSCNFPVQISPFASEPGKMGHLPRQDMRTSLRLHGFGDTWVLRLLRSGFLDCVLPHRLPL